MADCEQQLQLQVKEAFDKGTPLRIVGADTKSFMGRPCKGQPLNTAEHSGIINYQPTELVVTARAGTPLPEISAALAENGQFLPFEPPEFEGRATLGGTLATNLSGPARPWRGSIRDAVLGVGLINGRGEQLRFGGQVMKNVAGYDVSRLQAGAMGTLGLITQVSLKILPRPAASLTLQREMRVEAALDWMNQLAGQPNPLSASAWSEGHAYIRLEGAASAVAAAAKKLDGTQLENANVFWSQLGEQQLDYFQTPDQLWRFSMDSAAPHKKSGADWLIDWGGAQRWLKGNFEKSALESEAQRWQGHLSLYRGGNRAGEVLHKLSDGQKKLQLKIKQAFDPKGILNPGRMYSWM